jgi:hypothetical protein
VAWAKWLFLENSPGKAKTFSSCSSSHTDSVMFFHSSQYPNFSKIRLRLSRHWLMYIRLLGCFAHLNEYYIPLKPVTTSFTHCI